MMSAAGDVKSTIIKKNDDDYSSSTQKTAAPLEALSDNGGDGSSLSPSSRVANVQEQCDADNIQRSSAKRDEAGGSFHNEQQLLVAALHRDGEQARIIEVIRRRQQQQQQQQYTFEYFWGSVLYYSGFADEHPSSMHEFHDKQSDDENYGTENLITTDDESDKGKLTPTLEPVVDKAVLREKEYAEKLAKQPCILRAAFIFYRRIHLVLRWFIDFCITRLARLEPLSRSTSFYATTPSYSLHVQADDIINFIAFLWMSLWICSRTSHVLYLAIIMFCLVMGSIGGKVVGRVELAPHQLQDHAVDSTSNSTRTPMPPVVSRTSETEKKGAETSNSINRLRKCHPNATEAECIRFLRCTKSDEKAASERIEGWFAWRLENGLTLTINEGVVNHDLEKETITIPYGHNFMKADEKLWDETAKMAIEIMSKSSVHTNGTENNVQLPQIICSYEMHRTSDAGAVNGINNDDCERSSSSTPPRCKDGSRIFHLVPARLDLSLATAQVYALAAALYLDRRLSRHTTEKISLICDVRGGRGFANPTPWTLLPFIQATSSLLGKHFPERLRRMVLFPMPSSAVWVWAAAQKFLDTDTASKVIVVGLDGAVSKNDNGMYNELGKFITKKDYLLLEERRRSFFARKNS